jgi:hypothetical protein
MAKLNRELTEKLFKCVSNEDVQAVIATGEDLLTASRMAIDEVLKKVYNKRCTGVKEHAVEMLKGAATGVDVPDVAVTPNLNAPAKPEVPTMDPEERMSRMKNRAEELVAGAKDNFIRFTQLKRDAELKMLGFNEDDCKFVAKDNEKIVCGADSSGKLYLMKRDQAVMDDLSSKWGDRYF